MADSKVQLTSATSTKSLPSNKDTQSSNNVVRVAKKTVSSRSSDGTPLPASIDKKDSQLIPDSKTSKEKLIKLSTDKTSAIKQRGFVVSTSLSKQTTPTKHPVKFDSPFSAPTYYTYVRLKAPGPYPKGVDVNQRELFLSPLEFRNVFGMSREQFNCLSLDKKRLLKKQKDLI
jgi:hypothetical protein